MGVSFANDEPFESYRARLKEHFVMTREAGVIEVRMHENGESPRWSYELHRALPQMFAAIGQDRENELLILTSTGDHWLTEFNAESYGISQEEFLKRCYDLWYLDGTKLQENLLWGLEIPIIAAVNGLGFHYEIPLLADLTICTPGTRFMESHLAFDSVPGDANYLVLQELLGIKRANYVALLGTGIEAKEALSLGLVNEVVPLDELMPRARELAAGVMKNSRIVRRLTTQVMRRRWKRLFTDDFNMHFGFELFAATVAETRHDNETVNQLKAKIAADRLKGGT